MSDVIPRLTSRQREVLGPLTNGLTNREIGQRLYLSPNNDIYNAHARTAFHQVWK